MMPSMTHGTSWVVTRVTWIRPHRAPENTEYACHVSSILPRQFPCVFIWTNGIMPCGALGGERKGAPASGFATDFLYKLAWALPFYFNTIGIFPRNSLRMVCWTRQSLICQYQSSVPFVLHFEICWSPICCTLDLWLLRSSISVITPS